VPLLHRLREWPNDQSTVKLTRQLTTDYFHAENFEGVGQGTSEFLFSIHTDAYQRQSTFYASTVARAIPARIGL
jgi:hypothetical protein